MKRKRKPMKIRDIKTRVLKTTKSNLRNIQIINEYLNNNKSVIKIAKEFNITRAGVYSILHNHEVIEVEEKQDEKQNKSI